MVMPEQIKKQSEDIQKLYAEMNGEAQKPTPPAPEQSTASNSANDPPTAAAQTEQASAAAQSEATFEQKYRTLQGMYNKEVPALHAQNRDLISRVQGLEQILASMQSASTTSPAAAPAKALTDKDVEEYGDALDVMRRAAREEISGYQSRVAELEQMVRNLQSNVLPRVDQLAQHQFRASDQMFWDTLNRSVPDWESVNVNPDFQSWLLEVDPLTRRTRQSYLEEAQKSLDAQRVASFFITWKGHTGAGAAQNTPPAASAATELERHVSPGRSRTSSAPASQEQKTWSSADIRKFYADVSTGKYRSNPEERARIERDIFAAQRENRIVA